ncbi:hypothetical protein ACFOY8_12055 [Thalassospira xianhensis]|uniref:Uncharacterized protein n=1 Tax=Thalassospira xianhensis MCCC 1A02616 TaxID=1177929 RepID=A0A367U818_9PROT|nr:hypothetical protein [Thalassospira xianhensis]RCK04161.1 hypothetical protein TH5_21550 [Thalassospira xianhensis MCCC 1A02616]
MRTEIFDVPFQYGIRHIPPKGRKEQDGAVQDVLSVSVRSLTSDEAPVAMIVREATDGRQTLSEVEIRHVDGTFFRPVDPTISTQAAIEQHFGEFKSVDNFLGAKRELTQSVGRLISDERRKVVAGIVNHASVLSVIDGHLYRSCKEPVWQLRYESGRHILRPNLGIYGSYGCNETLSIYRADMLEQALSVDPVEVCGSIEVLQSQTLALEPASAALFVEVYNNLREVRVEDFIEGSMAFHVAYVELRDFFSQNYPKGQYVSNHVSSAQLHALAFNYLAALDKDSFTSNQARLSKAVARFDNEVLAFAVGIDASIPSYR